MSRSRRKPFSTICTGRNGEDKRKANRKFRRASKTILGGEDYEKLPISIREVSDVWDFSTDGLAHYRVDSDETLTRK